MTDPDNSYPTQTRWKQRFQNFERALALLEEPLARQAVADFSLLEQQGLVQRFEFCFELAWKVMKDYLLFSGVLLDQLTPRHVIKQAFSAGLIADGQAWIDMLDARNLLSHTYNQERFETALEQIQARYLSILVQLREKLAQ